MTVISRHAAVAVPHEVPEVLNVDSGDCAYTLVGALDLGGHQHAGQEPLLPRLHVWKRPRVLEATGMSFESPPPE